MRTYLGLGEEGGGGGQGRETMRLGERTGKEEDPPATYMDMSAVLVCLARGCLRFVGLENTAECCCSSEAGA